jgi:large subunit ribosomal protein L36e
MLTASNIVYAPTVLFVKLSIVLLYFRIFSVDRTMRWFTYGASAFLVVFYVSQTCVAIAVAALCTSPPPNPHICSDLYKNTILQAVFNVATDFAVLSLPIIKVSRLQMSARRKVGVNAIFAVGLM